MHHFEYIDAKFTRELTTPTPNSKKLADISTTAIAPLLSAIVLHLSKLRIFTKLSNLAELTHLHLYNGARITPS